MTGVWRDSTAPSRAGAAALPVAAGVLALVCLAAFWNSFRAPLLLDNQTIILKDPRLQAASWQNVRDIFTHHYWWPSLESHLYRPLTTLSYWVNWSVIGGGADPTGYHAVNLALHWVNAVLACGLVRAMTGRPWPALFATAVFASHPLTVEAVTNIVGRADLLATLSVIVGVVLYRAFLASVGSRRRACLAGLGLTYLAGVLCKENAVVLPGLLVLHDAAFPPADRGTGAAGVRTWFARTWPAYLALVPGLAVLAAARWALFRDSLLFGEFASDNPIVIAPLLTGVMTAVKVAGYGLGLAAWPAKLSCDYSYNAVTLFGGTFASGQDLHAWIALAAIAGLFVMTVLAWRRDRAAGFFLGFAAVTYLPTSNLIFPIGTIMAERLLYLPLVGLAAAAALGVDAIRRHVPAPRSRGARRGQDAAWAAAGLAIVAALVARTVVRNADWADNERLWSSSAAAAPGSIKTIRALAAIAMAADPSGARADEAIGIAMQGLRILDASPLPLPHMPAALFEDLGTYRAAKATRLASEGRHGEASAELRTAVAMFERAAEVDRAITQRGRERMISAGRSRDAVPENGTPSIYRKLGGAYLEAGDPLRAADTLAFLERIRPAGADSHYVRGMAEGAAADLEQVRGEGRLAAEHLERAAISLVSAVLLDPAHAPSWQALERVYGAMGGLPGALGSAGGRPVLNRADPVASRHIAQACATLARAFREAPPAGVGRRLPAECGAPGGR